MSNPSIQFQASLNKAMQGDPIEQYMVGYCYSVGINVSKNEEKAKEFSDLALTKLKEIQNRAEKGNARAEFVWGMVHANGQRVNQDDKTAAIWCKKAAERGDAFGQNQLGFMYKNGRGFQQNYDEALKWYRKAAEQGNASGQFNLGYMYQNGQGVQQNYDEALKWYKKAAEQGYASGQINLGNMYKNGRGVQQNCDEALKWYKKAAEQGNASGQFALGLMYQDGLGVQQNNDEALKWYRKAAEQGHALGQVNLGVMYEDGLGVQQSYDEALKWYKKAAEQGNADGQANLGRMYKNGLGVQQNYGEAVKWYRKAAEQGDEQARNNLEQVQKQGHGVQQSKGSQNQPQKLAEFKKVQVPIRPEGVHKPSPHTPIVKKPTPTPQQVAVTEATPKKEPVKPSQEKKFKETPEQAEAEDLDYHETLLSQHWEIKSGDLKEKVEVATGGCGIVYKGLWQGSPVAIKELHGRLGSAELEELRKEALIMSQLHHPHVIHLFGITRTPPYCLTMEWMEKGSFYDALRKEQLNLEQKGKILLGAARGLAFLHSKNMIHRDIKSLNILLKKSYKAKIGDFGLSQVKKSLRSQSKHTSTAGTIQWKAPELFKLGGKHTPASDIYAFGIVMWEALTGKDPYEEAEDMCQIPYYVQDGGRLEIPQGTPQWYRELMERCWSQNPQDRPKAEEVASIIAKCLEQKPEQAEKPQRPTLPTRPRPTSSGYLVHTPQPAKKPGSRVSVMSSYLENFYSQQSK